MEPDGIDERQPLIQDDKNEADYGASQDGDVTVKIKDGKTEETKDSEEKKPPPVSFGNLFRYATAWDRLLMIWGSLWAATHGAGWPVLSIVFGDMTDTFIGGPNATANGTGGNYDQVMTEYMLRYFYIGIAVYCASFFQISCWMASCERQTNKMRLAFYRAILRQEIGWFDKHQSGELSTRLADDLERVREGIGDKFSIFIQFMAAFFSGFAIGFWKGWRLTLVMMSLTPLLAICGAFLAKFIASIATREQAAYAAAGSVAEEMLSCIRTVVSFCGQKRAIQKYEEALTESKRLGNRKALLTAIGLCLTMIILYSAYALAFWYGSTQVATWQETLGLEGISPGEVFTVFFCVMIGSFSIGNAFPNITNIATAKGAAAVLYEVIDNEPSIDASSDEGLRPDTVKGHIELFNCEFAYPTRPDVQVLKNFSMNVEQGKTVALVGASGCGKSTVINLLQRFYDVHSGQITIDGTNIKDLNIRWLRQQIGVVSQEPILFGCSIQENILYGREGVTEAEIIKAAEMANAHKFISQLPKGYETLVGERGAQLSGGQKQRVAIARALVRDPKILLLDEATAALDVESEKMVQDALDKAREGRTTIIVAHRLSTIQNADLIYAVQGGQVMEIGTHAELMAKGGIYQQLVTLQLFGDNSKKQDNEEVEEAKTPEGFKIKRMLSRSKSKTSIHEKEEEEDDVEIPGFFKIFRANLPEIGFILVGCLASLVIGATMPIFAVFFSNIIKVFMETGDQLKKDALFWSLMFLALGGATGIGQFFNNTMFGTSGERLTMRLRLQTFTSMLGQEISWFDEPKHATGALTTRLATDASLIKTATGIRVGIILQAMFGMAAGIGISLYFGWKLALAVLAMVPILVFAGAIQMKALTGKQKRDSKLLEDAGRLATESIENIRTLQSLTLEERMYATYQILLLKPHREAIKQCFIYGVSYGLSQGVIFIMYGGAFKFGSYLVETGDMAPDSVYRVFFAIAFTGLGLGQASSFLPEYSKARLAAGHIFRILENVPFIDSYSTDGKMLTDIQGSIEFENVSFKYPTRPDVRVLTHISFTIPKGRTVALVGHSGCGKSTMVALLQRFYDPEQGKIKIDDVDIRELNVQWLRSQISVVSQEPVLFDITIKENIAYGVEGDVDDQAIFDAAKLANIHDFIVSLPQGYDTVVGEKGTQLSGGQKQRVAIARAMIGNPKILLLDEATSALDTESERVVQQALDRAREGRTCLIIAHRLSTVQTADAIAVVDNGEIVEMGTPNDLLEQKGAYYTLASGQLNLV